MNKMAMGVVALTAVLASPMAMAEDIIVQANETKSITSTPTEQPESAEIHGTLTVSGAPWWRDLPPMGGHVVVKVAPGGASYRVFTLSPYDEELRVTGVWNGVSGQPQKADARP